MLVIMTVFVPFRAFFFFVIPSGSEESSVWMLRSAQQANLTLSASQTSLSLQKERDVSATPKQGEVNPVRGCFAALTLRSA